jgi:PadR family transcriptional regulator, regulatory protein PadR
MALRMTRSRRPSAQTAAVVRALAETPSAWRYGYELCQQLGLKAGSMYPILMRLADRGLLETAWERDAPAGRPPRHLYRLTGPGLALAAELETPAAAPARRPAQGEARRRPERRLPEGRPAGSVIPGATS